ncbi:unnamed protein product, partial [Porites lobata]
WIVFSYRQLFFFYFLIMLDTTMQRTMPVDHEGSARTSEENDIKESEDPEEVYIDAEEREKMELDDELLLRAATQGKANYGSSLSYFSAV